MSGAAMRETGLAGVVISGGRSERLGRDKAGEILGRSTLLERVLATLDEVVDMSLVIGPWAPDGVERSEESSRFQGPLRAFAHAARILPVPHLILTGCDQPFLQTELLAYLAGRRHEADAVVAVGPEGIEPLPAVYSTVLGPAAESLLQEGSRSLKRLIRTSNVLRVGESLWRSHDPEGLSFVDVDDEAALERARRRVAEQDAQ